MTFYKDYCLMFRYWDGVYKAEGVDLFQTEVAV